VQYRKVNGFLGLTIWSNYLGIYSHRPIQNKNKDFLRALPATLPKRSLHDHLRSQTSSAWKAAPTANLAAENVSARGRGVGPLAHINPFQRSLSMSSLPFPLLHYGAAVVIPFLYVLGGQLPRAVN
jgi:hypothetical protein